MASGLERFKDITVDLLMFKRGVFQKRFWHGSMIGLSAFGLVTSGLFGGQTLVSSSFPGVGGQDPRLVNNFERLPDDPVLNSLFDTRTTISQKPRSEIIEYEVQSGDTISSIADKFAISAETIKWANDLDNVNTIKPGQKLKIEKLDKKEGEEIAFADVLLLEKQNKLEVGTPFVAGGKVTAKVLGHGKGKKLIVFKYKAKKRYHLKKGHRQPFTEVEILKIDAGS